jgi:hypothetical protein
LGFGEFDCELHGSLLPHGHDEFQNWQARFLPIPSRLSRMHVRARLAVAQPKSFTTAAAFLSIEEVAVPPRGDS